MKNNTKPRNLAVSRRSQEEMAGFILIVVLVVIIGVVFLVISVRKPVERLDNKEVSAFLESSMLYTTNCKPNNESFYDFEDVISACLDNENCLDGTSSCQVLNETAIGLIEKSFLKQKGYEFRISSGNETMFFLKNGDSTGIISGSELKRPGNSVTINLKIFIEN